MARTLQAYATVALLVALAIAVIATPAPQSWILRDSQLYALRANCSNEPWHGRPLVLLPTSQRVGFENFTASPETPPLKFLPIRLHENEDRYALQGVYFGEDLSRTPYLAALANNATRTVSLKIVYLPSPLRESFETQTDACPDGYECAADQWTFGPNNPRPGDTQSILYNFRFGGFRGTWEPFKDAGKEGWHVYWKGNAGIHHPVQLDLVPVLQSERLVT